MLDVVAARFSNRGMKFHFGTFSQTCTHKIPQYNTESVLGDKFQAIHGLNLLTLF